MTKKQLAIITMIPVLGFALTNSALAANDESFKNIKKERSSFSELRDDRNKGFEMRDKQDRPDGNRGKHTGQVNDPELQKILGMTAEQIRTELQSGKTIKDLITAKGLDFNQVMKQLRVDDSIKTKEKMNQTQIDALKAKKSEFEAKEIDRLAKILGTTVEVIKSDRDAGKTLDETIVSLGLNKEVVMQKLKESRETEMKERLAQDVQSGKITQAQADKIIKKMSEIDLKQKEKLAKVLGMTPTELVVAINSGKSIETIILEKGLSKDDVKMALNESRSNEAPKGIFKKMGEKLKIFFGNKN